MYKSRNDYEITEVPDGFVIYDEPNGKVHYLNPTAAVIYSICDVARSVDEIQLFIQSAYDLEEEVEISGFLDDLEKAGLICQTQ